MRVIYYFPLEYKKKFSSNLKKAYIYRQFYALLKSNCYDKMILNFLIHRKLAKQNLYSTVEALMNDLILYQIFCLCLTDVIIPLLSINICCANLNIITLVTEHFTKQPKWVMNSKINHLFNYSYFLLHVICVIAAFLTFFKYLLYTYHFCNFEPFFTNYRKHDTNLLFCHVTYKKVENWKTYQKYYTKFCRLKWLHFIRLNPM